MEKKISFRKLQCNTVSHLVNSFSHAFLQSGVDCKEPLVWFKEPGICYTTDSGHSLGLFHSEYLRVLKQCKEDQAVYRAKAIWQTGLKTWRPKSKAKASSPSKGHHITTSYHDGKEWASESLLPENHQSPTFTPSSPNNSIWIWEL